MKCTWHLWHATPWNAIWIRALSEEPNAFGGFGQFEFFQRLDQGTLGKSHRALCPSVEMT